MMDHVCNDLAHQIQLQATSKPTFKPNPNLGEGKPLDDVMEYRKDLLNMVKTDLYQKAKPILDSDEADDQKITKIDQVVSNYIPKAQKLAEDKIRGMYRKGATKANQKLSKLGAKTAILPASTPRLEALVALQRDSVEDRALMVRGRLRMVIRTKSWYNFYGKKDSKGDDSE